MWFYVDTLCKQISLKFIWEPCFLSMLTFLGAIIFTVLCLLRDFWLFEIFPFGNLLQSPPLWYCSVKLFHDHPQGEGLFLFIGFLLNHYHSFSLNDTFNIFMCLCIFLSLQLNYKFLEIKSYAIFIFGVIEATKTMLEYSMNIAQINKIL